MEHKTHARFASMLHQLISRNRWFESCSISYIWRSLPGKLCAWAENTWPAVGIVKLYEKNLMCTIYIRECTINNNTSIIWVSWGSLEDSVWHVDNGGEPCIVLLLTMCDVYIKNHTKTRNCSNSFTSQTKIINMHLYNTHFPMFPQLSGWRGE